MRKRQVNMLKSHNFCLLKDSEGKNDVNVEINPDKKHIDIIKLTMNGKTATINKKELYTIAYLIADEEAQDRMTPTVNVEVTKYVRSIKLKAEKDIKKGEIIVANVEVEVPTYFKKKFKGLKKPKGRIKGR